jgi:putative sigma-54 modulation protein
VDVAVVAGKDVVPDEVRDLARAKVARLGRLAPVLEQAEVRIVEAHDRPGARYSCEVTLAGHGHRLRARAASHELPAAVDLVVDKLEHQVERLKGKLLDRSHPRHRPQIDLA